MNVCKIGFNDPKCLKHFIQFFFRYLGDGKQIGVVSVKKLSLNSTFVSLIICFKIVSCNNKVSFWFSPVVYIFCWN